uniref:Uncharacterized protein n=1 Tax=Anguilla anguilla TaxID=7936 RepID=A0A0E9SDV3_ANGAN
MPTTQLTQNVRTVLLPCGGNVGTLKKRPSNVPRTFCASSEMALQMQTPCYFQLRCFISC